MENIRPEGQRPSRAPGDFADVGFYSFAVENTSGIAWKATVKASFNVAMIQGQIWLSLTIYRDSDFITNKNQVVSSPGPYGLTTSSYDVEPNHKYYAVAFICCSPPTDQAAAAKVRIPEIKWTVEF